MKKILDLFKPNNIIDKTTMSIMLGFQIALAIVFWFSTSSPLIPSPTEILSALQRMLTQEDLIRELWASISLCLEAIWKTILFSLIISYATVMPFFRPFAFIVSKGRFLTLVGLSFVFTLMTADGHHLKVWLLTFGMTVFFVTSMVSVIKAIPRGSFNHARTLRMSEWEVVWHVVIVGKIDQVFEVIRQNFAIAWMMLTMVEGISRSDGGIGTLLLNQNKHLHLDAVFAIQIVILIVGITQDYLIGFMKNTFCPYSNLTLERK
jgi:NitT/TauT family transport system permease protein